MNVLDFGFYYKFLEETIKDNSNDKTKLLEKIDSPLKLFLFANIIPLVYEIK